MFFVFVLDLKHSMHVSLKLLISFLLTLVALNPGFLYADDYVHMIQYELLFGNKQPVSNLYMSMQPGGMEHSLYDGNNQLVFRTPVISTDPHKLTLLKPLSILFETEDPDASTDSSAPDTSTGEQMANAATGAVMGLLLLGGIVYAIAKPIKETSDSFDNIEIDTLK